MIKLNDPEYFICKGCYNPQPETLFSTNKQGKRMATCDVCRERQKLIRQNKKKT